LRSIGFGSSRCKRVLRRARSGLATWTPGPSVTPGVEAFGAHPFKRRSRGIAGARRLCNGAPIVPNGSRRSQTCVHVGHMIACDLVGISKVLMSTVIKPGTSAHNVHRVAFNLEDISRQADQYLDQ